MQDTVIVIPALEPDIKLFHLLDSIRKEETELPILLIDDGSGPTYTEVFEKSRKFVSKIGRAHV